MARLYADEQFPRATSIILRRLGHDIVTTQESGRGNLGIPDEEVLAYAISTDRAVLTLNRNHYIRLHRKTLTHAGIVACTCNHDFNQLAQLIHKKLIENPVLSGKLLRVYRPG